MKSLDGDALSGSKSAVEFLNIDTLDVTKLSSCFVSISTVSFITFGEGGKIGIDLFLFFISFDVSIFMHFSTVGVLLLLRFRSIVRYIYAGFCFGLFIEN
jgi:hypothetical protein